MRGCRITSLTQHRPSGNALTTTSRASSRSSPSEWTRRPQGRPPYRCSSAKSSPVPRVTLSEHWWERNYVVTRSLTRLHTFIKAYKHLIENGFLDYCDDQLW